MEITKEQVLELAKNPVNEYQLKQWFPEAFRTKLEIGKWYKFIDKEGRLYLFNHQDNSKSYGFFRNEWSKVKMWNTSYGFDPAPIQASEAEVSEALIAEAKKRGFKKGVRFKVDNGTDGFCECNDVIIFSRNRLVSNHWEFFKDGIWAEILPEEKTVITREKALKIVAKKLKISPENLEIK